MPHNQAPGPRRFTDVFNQFGKGPQNNNNNSSPGSGAFKGGAQTFRQRRWNTESEDGQHNHPDQQQQQQQQSNPRNQPNTHSRSVKNVEKCYDMTEPLIDYSQIPPTLLTYLNCSWCLWYTSGPAKTAENFENCLIPVGSVSTAEAFWALYSHCIRPSALPRGTEYHLFRDGIRPMWEDPANVNGGTLMIRLKKNYLDYFWEALILAMIGERLGEDICGAVAGKRFTDDHLSIWNSEYSESARQRLSRAMLASLKLPADSPTDYKSHVGSLTHTLTQSGSGINQLQQQSNLGEPGGGLQLKTNEQTAEDNGDQTHERDDPNVAN